MALILIMSLQICGQQTTPVVNTDYQQKSKNQKTAAWIMLIGGTVATTIGFGVAVSGGLDCAFGDPRCGKDQTLADVLAISGSAAMLGSIPLFIAAGRNKKKAMSVSVSWQPAPSIIKNNLAHKTVPSITLKIGL
ncbi:MAG TPA: hypothetical protein VNA26_07425 [Chitinophagaceae bacterium]|nr:hypothetical protein [Chitinophagaceae bacterium]